MSIDDEIKELERVANVSVINEAIAKAANEHERAVVRDSISANRQGLTFLGNEIYKTPPFSDWFETGEFHNNLRFINQKSIEFVSSGDGFAAIRSAFDRSDYIAPSKATLSQNTMDNIEKLMYDLLFEKL
jgi:hypothetical protein